MRSMVVVAMIVLFAQVVYAGDTVGLILNNIEQNATQSVLRGGAKGIRISRGNAEFIFDGGEMTLYDFGSGRICAMTCTGHGQFTYIPPDDVERKQLIKFAKCDTLKGVMSDVVIFFTVELDPAIDTSGFQRLEAGKTSWDLLEKSRKEHFEHIGVNTTNSILGDLLSAGPGSYFDAQFTLNNSESYIYIEDPLNDDLYSLYHLYTKTNNDYADVVGGYTPDQSLPSQRGVAPIDISHYNLKSRIEQDGDMKVDCWIYFTPMTWGRRFIRLNMYGRNKITCALDSAGDTLKVIKHDESGGVFKSGRNESGFGIILNKPMELGIQDSIEIVYVCESLENSGGNYVVNGLTYWYPQNVIRDVSTYSMTFDIPKSLDIVCCGNLKESRVENGRNISNWELSNPVRYVSFSFGSYKTKEYAIENYTPVIIYMSENIPHQDWAMLLAYFGELSSANMIGKVGADVTNSLIFYSSIFGPCPFDTVRAVESYTIGEGQGSPGLIHLSWNTFQVDDMGGRDEMFRSHEVAHQWWGHIAGRESYRDTWITEGLSEYCGFWFYQMSSKKTKVCNGILADWQERIISGDGLDSKGSEAGPPILGWRLNSSKSDDYGTVVYEKGAYIFHMIRYLMHDYKTGSDDKFAAFLKDIALKFKNKPITTEKLRALLEEHVDGDMEWFFKQWVYGTDIPEYNVKVEYTESGDGKYGASCHIKQTKVPPDFQMIVPVTILFDDDKYIHLKVMIDQPEMDVDLPLFPYKPQKVIFNAFDAVLCKVKYDK
jgi:hypothetical protein